MLTHIISFLIARFTPQMFTSMGYGVYLFFASLMVISIFYVFVSTLLFRRLACRTDSAVVPPTRDEAGASRTYGRIICA